MIRPSGVVDEIPWLLFFSTLGVYTLHRMISYRRASVIPETKRYALVKRHFYLSLAIGLSSIALAAYLLLEYLPRLWPTLLIAAVLTAFYLVPPLPGWRRLRDIPYLKVVWVAAAWTIMTHDVPLRMVQGHFIGVCGGTFAEVNTSAINIREYICRFAFVLAVALLFDLRDIKLDKLHGIKTVANSHPKLLQIIVPLLLLVCSVLGFANTVVMPYPISYAITLAASYLLCIPVALLTFNFQEEDWYAIAVNGLLLFPVVFCLAWHYFSHSLIINIY